MTITHQTVIDQIEITRAGPIQVRFGLLLAEDGVEVDCKWHRTSIEPGVNLEAQIAAVNAHLMQMGRQPCPRSEIARLSAIVFLVHTPAVVRAFQAQGVRESRGADAIFLPLHLLP